MKIKEKIIDTISSLSEMENVKQYLSENDDLSKIEMNSLSFIKIVVALESEFGFEFDDEMLDYNRFASLNTLCNYVKEQMKLSNSITV
ncbi:MAG TPA: phosphopantetheine attachment site [Clostridiales bacterium]|nr:phosphopantetheine attachment site [Clostridiales bacterium]